MKQFFSRGNEIFKIQHEREQKNAPTIVRTKI